MVFDNAENVGISFCLGTSLCERVIRQHLHTCSLLMPYVEQEHCLLVKVPIYAHRSFFNAPHPNSVWHKIILVSHAYVSFMSPIMYIWMNVAKVYYQELKDFSVGFFAPRVCLVFFCPFRISPFDIFAFSSFLIWGLVALPRKYWWNWKSNEWAYRSRHRWWRIQCHGDAPVKTCAFSRSICFLPIVLECDSLAVKTHKLSFSLDRRLPVPFNIWYMFVCVNVSVSSAPRPHQAKCTTQRQHFNPVALVWWLCTKSFLPFFWFPSSYSAAATAATAAGESHSMCHCFAFSSVTTLFASFRLKRL